MIRFFKSQKSRLKIIRQMRHFSIFLTFLREFFQQNSAIAKQRNKTKVQFFDVNSETKKEKLKNQPFFGLFA